MRLEKLLDLVLEYDDDSPVVVRLSGGEEGQGFGTGTGRAEGAVQGPVRWADFPRLREDGVFLPESRGVIVTPDGPVLWQASGISRVPDEQDQRRIVGSIRFFTQVPGLRELNDSVAVHGGQLDLESGVVLLPVWLCRPEV